MKKGGACGNNYSHGEINMDIKKRKSILSLSNSTQINLCNHILNMFVDLCKKEDSCALYDFHGKTLDKYLGNFWQDYLLTSEEFSLQAKIILIFIKNLELRTKKSGISLIGVYKHIGTKGHNDQHVELYLREYRLIN
jgi:hypothetical protein